MSRQFRSDDTSPWKEGFGKGTDGNLTISSNTTEAPIDASCSGTSGTTSLSATNASFATGQLIIIHQTRGTGAGNWELNKIAGYTAGTITTSYTLENTYTDSGASQAQVRVMPQYNDVTINSSQTWTAKAWTGDVGGILAFFAKGTVTVTGNILASLKGFRNYTSGSYQNTTFTGEGSAGAGWTNSNSANGSGGGGGSGGTSQGGGGGGGHSGSGTSGTGSPAGGTGGGSVGNASLTSLNFGGASGTGGFKDSSSGSHTKSGDGGGIILIIANSLSVGGTIITAGGTGQNEVTNHNADGGGAGGAILLKCKTATLGTTKVTALKGNGGTTGSGSAGAGSDGRIHIDYKTSYTGTTNPTLDATQDATLDYPASSNFLMFFT